jgi:8-oxo-dGTP pyrophosphatase MutT (NUDIX family)
VPNVGLVERWTICTAGHVHWGADGAAGLLLWCRGAENGNSTYLLTQRARSVDEPGTWSVPGGAIRAGESPEAAADREATEEIGKLPPYQSVGIEPQPCGGGWCFYLVQAEVDEEFTAYCVRETDATGWFRLADMGQLDLHPGMRGWLTRTVGQEPGALRRRARRQRRNHKQ